MRWGAIFFIVMWNVFSHFGGWEAIIRKGYFNGENRVPIKKTGLLKAQRNQCGPFASSAELPHTYSFD